MKIRYFISKMKDVKIGDLLSVFPMLIAAAVSPFFKKKYANVWLICEEKKEARDNGYWFFRKMVENHPEQKCIYAIDKKSVDYRNVQDLGEVIQYSSLRHWIVYFTCEFNISSQKGGKPNAAICAFLELNHLFAAHCIFLQHGVIINDLRWLYADRSIFDMFITSTIYEKQFIEERFGFPEGTIQLTGLPRFDNLHQNRTNYRRILVMPTWRSWFNLKSKQKEGLDTDFESSEYFEKWKEFLESDHLNQLITEHKLEVIFYPHRNMQRYLSKMRKDIQTKAIIASWENYDIQELLITSALMVTDYSSVFFDMIYMKKPIIFYQFDLDKFRMGQYEQGYFDYSNNPYGKSFKEPELLFDEMSDIIRKGFECDLKYKEAHRKSFPYYDTFNCERVFQGIQNVRKRR